MASTWSFLIVVMVSLYGVSLSIPSHDRNEPRTGLISESSAQEEASESMALSAPSLVKSRPQRTVSKILNLKGVVERVRHLIYGVASAVNKDSLLATSLVDDSLAKWIKKVHQILPVFPIKYAQPHDIENPTDDKHSPLWDYFLAILLSGHKFVQVGTEDTDGDKGAKKDNAVTTTSINFDPFGKLLGMIKDVFKDGVHFHSVTEWWQKMKTHLNAFSVFKEDKTEFTGRQDLVNVFGIGVPQYFFGGYSVGDFDLLKLTLNALAFVAIRLLFLRMYLPSYDYDYDSYPDVEDNPYDEDEDEEDEGYGEDDDEEEEKEYYNNDPYGDHHSQSEGDDHNHYDSSNHDEETHDDGFHQFTYHDFGGHEGFEQDSYQGHDQDGLYQSSYQGYDQDERADRHTTGWHSQSTHNGHIYRGNGQGTIPRNSYRNSRGRGRIYRNNYRRRYPKSFGYRLNNAGKNG